MNRHQKLLQFCLDKSADEPVALRTELYLALADICGNSTEAASLRSMAEVLQRADACCREFSFAKK